ncbi:MAG: DNA polymerase III subunit beta [Oscillospiraceae bacterium]|jgi:DNA polymerase-3 subunit beta|nr:DNA polymerase III subunit beta [Oscillospiraceae bacterium]
MKFSVEKNTLYDVVSSASRACALKSSLNILNGVLINLSGDILTVTGYDLDVGIKASVSVNGGEDGETVTDPRLLSEIVKKMPDKTVEFTVKNNKEIKITSGKSVLSIPCKSGDDFPNIIEIKKEFSFEINEKLFKEMLTRIDYASSKNDANPSLMGIKMEISENVFYSVATDGNRLAAKKKNIQAENMDIIIPEKAVGSLIRSLSEEEEDGDEPKNVKISIDKNQVCLSKENYMIISRLLEGKFVNYKKIIEGEYTKKITVNVRELASSMERCLLLISEKLKSPVCCNVFDDYMKISCKTVSGEIEDEISVTGKEGDFSDFSIYFNPRFMLEALQKTFCDEVNIYFENNLKPFKITPTQDDGEFIFIIVPIRSG